MIHRPSSCPPTSNVKLMRWCERLDEPLTSGPPASPGGWLSRRAFEAGCAADQCGFETMENHAVTVALYFVHYNFARLHQAPRVTPAMEAGRADHAWAIEEVVAVLG